MTLNSLTIAQAFLRVKFSALLVALLCTGLASSAAAVGFQIKEKDLRILPFEKHADYLALSVSHEPIAKLRQQLEEKLKSPLKNRGEAHVTVITPPEFEILKKHLSMDEINALAIANRMESSDLKVRCLGRGSKAPDLDTYFLVVQSSNLLKLRQKMEAAWKSKGGQGEFQARHFFPHITIGFTQRDLHEADGVIKDERSCLYDLSPR